MSTSINEVSPDGDLGAKLLATKEIQGWLSGLTHGAHSGLSTFDKKALVEAVQYAIMKYHDDSVDMGDRHPPPAERMGS